MHRFSSLYLLLFRSFFYLLYNPFAQSYDWVANIVSLGLWKKWVLSISTDIDCSPILELGHGPGHLQVELAAQGHTIYGLDVSKNMSRLAYFKLTQKGFSPRVVNGYAQYLPFAHEVINTVVATFPSEYILDQNTLSEIYRVLTHHGRFIWLPAAWVTGNNFLHTITAKIFRITHQVPSEEPKVINQLNQLLDNCGFTVKNELREINQSTILIITAIKP